MNVSIKIFMYFIKNFVVKPMRMMAAPISLLGLTLFLQYSSTSFSQIAPDRPQGKPWLGIAIEKGKQGVAVKGVLPKTPAESAGLQTGDEVLTVDKKTVHEPTELIKQIRSYGIGQDVTLEILRGSKTITKTLRLVMKPDEVQLIRDKFIGKPAPDFKLQSVHGKAPVALTDLKGKVTILEFWATWCPACKASHPRLSQFASQHPEIAVIAVSDEEKDVVEAYAKKINPAFTIAIDPEHKIFETWMASGIPMLVVIDKNGKITEIGVGAGDGVEDVIKNALNQK